ncbi:MAG: hypothetical protein ACT4P0_00375 [Panacagrimonas sp.]
MRMQLAVAGLAVAMLSGCAYVKSFTERSPSDDRPILAQTQTEEIRSVDEPLPPLEASNPTEPRRRRADVSEKKVDLFGDDRFSADRGALQGATDPMRPAPRGVRASPQGRDENVLMAPMAGRVGIMNLLGKELWHVHAGTTPLGNHQKSYVVQYDFAGYVVEELRKSLVTKTPYQPVLVNPTGALLRSASKWQETWNGSAFAPVFQREFDGIIAQNRLAMLIIVSYPTIDDGVVGTSQTLTGSGLYTRSLLGSTKAAVFSTVQFYRITGKPAQLVLPVVAPGDRSIGDLPNSHLPDDLDDLPARYLGPVYEPMRIIVQNKIKGLIELPRKLGY